MNPTGTALNALGPVLLRLGIVLQLVSCVGRLDVPALAGPHEDEERRILVTFVDRSIGRDVPANPLDRYRFRGRYANSSWSSQMAQALAQQYGLRLMAEWPVTALGVACVVYEVPLGRAVGEVLKVLAEDSRVESVQSMHTFRVSGDKSSKTSPYNDPYYGLQRDLQAMRIEAAHRLAVGRGIRVAVIDSGIDTDHPDLSTQVSLSENLAANGSEQETAEVHGTAVAGVIAARAQNGIGIVGIAPAAELYALRACWSEYPGSTEAECNSFTLALGLNEAIRLKVHIINLSLAGPGDPLIGRLIRSALDQGILIVASDAGERGSANSFPADIERVIAVRSEAVQSNLNNRLEDRLSAPGSNILTTLPHGTYDFMSGSSFAAPHISGLLALMLEVKPQMTREEALRALHNRRQTVSGPASGDSDAVVDACLALSQLSGTQACRETLVNP